MFENVQPVGSVVNHLHFRHLGAVLQFLRSNKVVDEAIKQATDRGISYQDILEIVVPAAVDFAMKKPVDVPAIGKALNALWNKPPEEKRLDAVREADIESIEKKKKPTPAAESPAK